MAQTTSIKHKGWKWSTADESNPTLVLVVDDTSKAVHIADASDAGADWAVSADSYPSLYIHTAGSNVAGDYVKIWHDDTDANIACYNATALNFLIDTTAYLEMTTSALAPSTTNVMALGTASLNFTDIYLDSGGVLYCDGSNAILTMTSSALTVTPATTFSSTIAVTNTATFNGAVNVGAAGTGSNVTFYTTNADKDMIFNATTARLIFDDVDIHLGDNDFLRFGDYESGDVRMVWDGEELDIYGLHDTGAIRFGKGGTDLDVTFYLGGVSNVWNFNVGDGRIDLHGAELRIHSDARIEFGDAGKYMYSSSMAPSTDILDIVTNGRLNIYATTSISLMDPPNGMGIAPTYITIRGNNHLNLRDDHSYLASGATGKMVIFTDNASSDAIQLNPTGSMAGVYVSGYLCLFNAGSVDGNRDGQIWYDGGANQFKGWSNGSQVALSTAN